MARGKKETRERVRREWRKEKTIKRIKRVIMGRGERKERPEQGND